MKTRKHTGGLVARALVGVALLAATSLQAQARPITRDQALRQAQEFMLQRGDQHLLAPVAPQRMLGASRRAMMPTPQTAAPYYVFDRGEQEGFVIMAGDDAAAEQVLGYCDSGSFDYDRMPPAMLEWLEGYATQMERLAENEGAAQAPRRVATHPAIAQLMKSQWSQGSPYNDECPMYFNVGRSVTGCVATAYAQILYYQREKMVTETQAAMPAYSGWTAHPTYGNLQVEGIPKSSPIDWDGMQDTYGSGASARAKKAVAQLMHYCGVGVKMDYTNSASGAQSYEVYNALTKYFGFGSSVRYVSYTSVSSDDQWDELAYNELAAGRPFYISGANSEAGHAFVCDGYDGNRRYHINWGWGGMSDGFYYLSNLTPGQQGIGGSSDGYNTYRECVMGIEPENYGEKAMTFTDATARRLCTQAWDLDGDGKLSYGEAAAVTSLGTVLQGSTIKSFTELHYFTGLTAIDDDALSGCTQLTTVQLPKGITTIGARAFKGCTKLQAPTLPDALTTLGEEAFADCSSLKTIALPQGVRALQAGTFRGCQALTTVTLPTALTQLGDGAFADCPALADFTVSTMRPEAITMGSAVFGTAPLAAATLHVMQGTRTYFAAHNQWSLFATIKEVRDISGGRFVPLTEGTLLYLHHVGTGRYLTKGEAWGTQAVVGADQPMRFVLKHQTSMPEGVYQLTSNDTGKSGHYLFRTTNDSSVGNGVLATFVDGTTLTQASHWLVTDLGDNTYTLSVPQGYANYNSACRWGVLTSHASNAASPTWGVYADVEYEGNELNCQWRFVAYDADQAANYAAAQKLQSLIDIAVGRKLNTDAEQAVLDRMESTLDEIIEAQRTLRLKLGLVHFADAEAREACVEEFDIDADGEVSFTEAAMVTDLGLVFSNVGITSLDELQYFTALKDIKGNAFNGCSKMTSIVLPQSVERIYYRAFRNCSSLQSVNLPEYISELGDNAFDGCTALTTVSVACPDPALITLGSQVFNRVNLSTATLLVPVGSKELYRQHAVWGQFGTISEMRTHTQPRFSPIAEGVPGYIYNVGTRKYLAKGEAYGTQAVVARQGLLYEWRRSKTTPEGQYYLYSTQTGQTGKVLFRTSTDSKVGSGVKACFVDGNTGTAAYWQVDSVAPLVYTLQVPATDATHVDGEWLGTQANHRNDAYSPTDGIYWDVAEGSGTQWAFITKADMDAAQEADARVDELLALLHTAQQQHLDTSAEQAVYDNLLSTDEQIRQAIASLREKLHYITFADSRAKAICVLQWDQDGDGELSLEEAARVADLGEVFRNQQQLKSLEELRHFTALKEIPENAFRNSSALTTVCLPQQVGQVGKYAFTGCSALRYMVLLHEGGVVETQLSGVPAACTLFVPQALLPQYQASETWQSYTTSAYTGVPVVRALPASRLYGRAQASMKFGVEGAPINGEPLLTCAEATDATVPVGTYAIHTTAGTITTPGLQCQDGELTITPAELVITAKSYTRSVGEPNPEFEVTYKGFRNRETADVLTQQPTVTCLATAESPIGEYAITVSGAQAQNYTMTYVDGVLTVSDPSGIAATQADSQPSQPLYDLQGRRVSSAARRGIYVNANHRKVVKR